MNQKTSASPLIEISHLTNQLGGKVIHENLNLTIDAGEIVAIIGGSGCGKTTLLRTILMLLRPVKGTIKVFNTDVIKCTPKQALAVQKRWGVLFQNNALFSSLTLLENVLYPLEEYTKLPKEMQRDIALLKILLVGLEADAANKYPGELSGGMQKRGALARAIALDAELLFFDEPTTGLDPNSASDLDQLILQLRDTLGITIVIVTHDIDTLWTVPDRVIFLGEKKVLAAAPLEELIKIDHPLIREYFSSPRAQMTGRNTSKTRADEH